MDVRLTDQQALLRQSVREFAEHEIRPHVRDWDARQHFPRELLPSLGALGLMGIQVAESRGGAGLSAVEYCLCIEELARVDPSVALMVAAHNGLGTAHLAMFGTDAQCGRWLADLAQGRRLAAWALTEAGSGSDAGAMRTTATRESDGGWRLDGAKQFITHGHSADVLVVVAVTDATKGTRGMSAFVIEQGTPGLQPGRKEDKLGMRASETSEVRFDGCRVPGSHLLGREGLGFVNALQVLDAGRIGIAALAVGLAQGAYEAARAYALSRTQFGRPIARFQAIRATLVDDAVRIQTARLLTWRAAALKDAGHRTSLESSMAKLHASEAAVQVAEHGVQIHGGYGFVKDYPAEKFFRDVKLTTIGEGTSEIQRLVIARQLLAS